MSDDVRVFLDALWREQQAAGLTDAQLASALNVDQARISRLRRGQAGRNLTLAFARRAAGRFPALEPLLFVR